MNSLVGNFYSERDNPNSNPELNTEILEYVGQSTVFQTVNLLLSRVVPRVSDCQLFSGSYIVSRNNMKRGRATYSFAITGFTMIDETPKWSTFNFASFTASIMALTEICIYRYIR